jgi:anti-sigma factor RsiW
MNKTIHPIEPEDLMAYLDGELPADRAAEASAHLKECVECQGLIGELRSVSQNLRAWQVGPPEASTPTAIATALAEERQESRSISPVPRRNWRAVLSQHWPTVAWVATAAAIFLIAFGTVRFQGGNANHAYSQVASQMQDSGSDRDELAARPSNGLAPAAKPAQRQVYDKLEMSAKLQQPSTVRAITQQKDQSAAEHVLVSDGPMIIRTAQLSLITKEFDKARANLEGILKRHRGYVGELKAGGTTGSGRTLTATLRIPADQLDATLTEVKTLGRVESESQSGQDVTSQYVDLQARLSNARNTEQRLTDLLRNRTGKLSDVLEVEQELDRVRGEIEQMEAERKNMSNQVSYATLNATIAEDYKAQLQVVPPSTSTRLSNAAVEGYRSMVDGVVSLALFLLSNGPSLLLWGAALFMPARLVWKKVRRSFAS